ncbi:MAG: peptide deformylase [Bacteroidetes bacterium GWF2_42_66]|nr:MAG: peptide deformylase [Bacteroidetes bacterium GWA2_42_15]OFX99163.1 MAG: peptide deformylase [Bacteroidetes bacterium GWE2_42_39]OFY40559.1 MAG: peptide deformylase [Bacteroidetes bacterium GWF2_42_66]HBL74510.1 peptide deformylase [Prolixibacteraceae bacterium]HCR91843.1 peptide deformylase [Prolixibacteraceae bacterium]
MIYPITVYGDPLLRQTAKPINKDYPELAKLIEDMFETMYFSDGVGLAAPQIGLSIRIFVIDATTYADEEPELANFKKAFINPEIIERTGDEWALNEGCLSLPEIREDIPRPEMVRIKYLDENFTEHDETYSGFAARVIQHEYDHLDGILFIDLLNPLKRRLLKSKLTAISKGKISTKYRQKLPGKK